MTEQVFTESPITYRWLNLENVIRKFTPAQIIDTVCKYFKVRKELVFIKRRKDEIVLARQVCCFFIKEKMKLPLVDIADLFTQDHTTVIHAIGKVKDRASTDTGYYNDIMNINGILGGEYISFRTVEDKYKAKIKIKVKPNAPKISDTPIKNIAARKVPAIYSNHSPFKIAK